MAAPGVLAVLTAADWAADGMGALRNLGFWMAEPLLMPDGRAYVNPERPPLPMTRVTFVGEAVAVVVAETAAQAMDAADLVEVAYSPLPAVAGTLSAVAVVGAASRRVRAWARSARRVALQRP